jgi:LCP family protein required for cell wall assembly
MSDFNHPQRFSRLDPELARTIRRGTPGVAGTKQRILEKALFVGVASFLVLAGLALYSGFAPSFRSVPNTIAEGIENDRVNIVILGVGGDTHPTGDRDHTDAILLVSLKPSTRQIALVSVPRDLYVPIGRYGTHRINRAHVIGINTGFPGGGPALSMHAISAALDQPVHAFVRVDFAGFRQMIDDLGGVEIEVQHSFYDFLFQDSFEKGRQLMNGDRALRYARYRHVRGEPDQTNYARENRQRQLVIALKEKLSAKSPQDVFRLIASARTVSRYTATNVSKPQMLWIYRTFRNHTSMQTVSLAPFTESVQIRTVVATGSAVRPVDNEFAPLRRAIAGVFDTQAPPERPKLAATPMIASPAIAATK